MDEIDDLCGDGLKTAAGPTMADYTAVFGKKKEKKGKVLKRPAKAAAPPPERKVMIKRIYSGGYHKEMNAVKGTSLSKEAAGLRARAKGKAAVAKWLADQS